MGALPVPGPVDEAILLLAAGLLYAFYREPMREAWTHTRPWPRSSHLGATGQDGRGPADIEVVER